MVTENINGTIGYTDNKDYMRNNLIPVIDTDVVKFAMKNSLNNYTDNNGICVYTEEYNACSLYEFAITNNANVTQELMITLNPSPNQYANLYYMMYEGKQETLTTSSKVAKNSTHINGNNSSVMANNIILKPEESKTYTVVFYILNLETIDQTSVDAGKHFGAIIRVDSITTGTYLSNTVGETCYDMEDLGDGTFKLTKFNGLNEDGNVVEGCEMTQDETTGLYSVTITSTIGTNQISTLGNNLFMAVVLDVNGKINSTNNYTKIKSIEVNEGIQYLEDGLASGTFAAIGIGITNEDYNLTVKLPNSLKNIGNMSFGMSALKEINLPNNLELIGSMSFISSNLNSITIPASVTTIGDSAFRECNITSLHIPYSVTSIGASAFYWNENLTRVIFEDTEENPSKLESIGEHAFYHDGLLYETEDDPLYMPASVTSIGDNAFDGNPDWTGKIYFIKYKGSQSNLDALGTSWYTHRYTVDVKAIG